MQSSLLLTTSTGISQLFNPSWSFTKGTMAVAKLFKAVEGTEVKPFDKAFLVYGNSVIPASYRTERGPENVRVTFYVQGGGVPIYVIDYLA